MWGERMRYWLGRRLLRRADLVLAVSQSTADDAVRFGRVDRQRAARHAGGGRRRVQASRRRVESGRPIGSASSRATCCSSVRWTRARTRRRCCARGRWRATPPGPAARHRRRAGSAGAASMPGARVLGHLSGPELADVYTAAGCLVFPSRYEGFGLPCLEALACGCPGGRLSQLEPARGRRRRGRAGRGRRRGRAGRGRREAGRCDSSVRGSPGIERAKTFSWRQAARDTIAAYKAVSTGRQSTSRETHESAMPVAIEDIVTAGITRHASH